MKSSGVWCSVPFLVVLGFVLILLPAEGSLHHGRRNQIPHLSSKSIGRSREYFSGNIPLSPNLSTCHSTPSETFQLPNRPSHEVNCCPPLPDSGKPIKDFQFPSPSTSPPLRIRRPAHRLALDKEYLVKYNKAVAIMKQLPSDHPHSFHRQAQIHCLYCNGAYYQANSDSSVPFKVHENWLFFPFHRFYVYFHERILGKLIGDDTFALPYWNYDSSDGMPIPDIYMKGELHDEKRDVRHFPPAPVGIDYTLDKVDSSNEPAAEQTTANLALLYNHMVSGATKPELFMGCMLRPGEDGACSGMGTIEIAPHNTVHLWVGNIAMPEFEDMGTLYAAARDPVFYAHHTNLDRLWALWRRLNGYEKSQPEFDDPQWLDSHFYFYDENVDLVRVKVRDALDMDKLRYAYEEVDLPWLDARPKPSVPPKVARSILRGKNFNDDMLRMATNKGPWTLEETVRVQVARVAKSSSSVKAREGEGEEEVLLVEGISIEKEMYAKFDIYINLVDESVASPKLREYAGCYVKMKGPDMAMKGRRNMKVGISEILKDLEAEEDESIWVSLVPRGGTGNVTRVDGMRIEYMQ